MKLRWYRVPEVWLVLLLLSASVAASFGMLTLAITHPDRTVAERPVGTR